MASPRYIPRTLETFLEDAATQFPALLVTGARQVGKTTILRHAAGKDRHYLTLDDPLILSLAKKDPALFLERFPAPVLIDEIQHAPELLPFIKMEIDKEGPKASFWLTGSQQFHLMKGISESLAGRVAVVQLLGLSRREAAGVGPSVRPFLPTRAAARAHADTGDRLTLRGLYRTIWRGGFPALALHNKLDRDLFFSSYVQTYIQRDIRDLARVGDEMAFLRFLRAAAARTGQMLNVAELSRDADVAPNTGKSWLSILQASGLVYLLEPYHTNVTKRLVKTPKLYFLDTGLAAYLTEWSTPETLEAGAMSGAILETWIVGELLKSYWHHGLRAPFHYYRDKDQKEIDLVIVKDGTAYPVELKKTASPREDDVRHFQALKKLKMPVGLGGIVCLSKEAMPLTPTVEVIPVGTL